MTESRIPKGNIQVTPEVSLNVDLDASAIVDIHVAMKEEELLQREKQLQEDLRSAEEVVKEAAGRLEGALNQIEKENQKDMSAEVFPALLSFGFKNLEGQCTVHIDKSTKRPMLKTEFTIYTGKGVQTHGIRTYKRTRMPKNISKLDKEVQAAGNEVQAIKDELLQVKQGLASVDRMERKARAQMAIRALESTAAGRKMLAGIRKDAVKALPAPK